MARDDRRPSPVRIVNVDVDHLDDPILTDAPDGTRIWLEVSRRGQVVGTRAASCHGGRVDQTSRDDVVRLFADAPTQDLSVVPDDRLPTVTVVVPTIFARRELIERTIDSITASHYPHLEVLLVDNRTAPDTPIPPFPDAPQVRIISEPTPGVSAARNRGIRESGGEVIAFTDDDVEVDSDWVRAIAVAFATNPDLDVVGGMVRPRVLETEPQLWFEEFFGGFTKSFQPRTWTVAEESVSDPLFPYDAGRFGAGNNIAVRRRVVELVGGFDVRLGVGTPTKSGEDLLFFIEVLLRGGTVGYVPSALVRHTHRATAREFRTQVFNYGIGLTAMFTALIVEDPRHLWRILRRLPRGLKTFFFPKEPKSLSETTSFPRTTMPVHALGMVVGPIAFCWSAVQMRGRRVPVVRNDR